MDTSHVIGIAASTFTSLTLLPQLIKIIRERDAKGTSHLMLLVLIVGLLLWVIYGVMQDDPIIIIANAVSLFITLLTGVFTLIYRRRPAAGKAR